jgi:hypothetical protein
MNAKKSGAGRTGGKVSSRNFRRKVASIFSRLAEMSEEQPARTASGVVKPLPIGDWRIDMAERRVAIFNRSREA